MSGAAQQAVGMGRKIVDVLAGGVDSCVHSPFSSPIDGPSSASETHKDTRLNVEATGHHAGTVTQSQRAVDEERSQAGSARDDQGGERSATSAASERRASTSRSGGGSVGSSDRLGGSTTTRPLQKVVDTLAGGVDSKASDPSDDPRLHVGATGAHVDSVTHSMRDQPSKGQHSGTTDYVIPSGFKPIDHHHGPGIARPGDASRMQNLSDAASRNIPQND